MSDVATGSGAGDPREARLPGPDWMRSDASGGAGAALARAALTPLSWGWAAVALARRFAYDRGLVPVVRLGVPVVSVGNLTAGGTGKTPCTLWVLDAARTIGCPLGLVTRGYGGEGGVNDEVEMVRARRLGAPIGVGADRVRVARELLREHPEIRGVLLDDAFQHRRVARDLDLLLVDATDPFGGGACLPRGLLREPASGLRRAGAVVMTRADQAPAAVRERLWERISALGWAGPRVEAVHAPAEVVPLDGARPALATEDLLGRDVRLLSAVAHPGSFRATVEQLGARVLEHRAFRDHHRYSPADLPDLRDGAAGALWLVTEKDAPKLRRLGVIDGWVLKVEWRVVVGEEWLRARLRAALGGAAAGG